MYGGKVDLLLAAWVHAWYGFSSSVTEGMRIPDEMGRP